MNTRGFTFLELAISLMLLFVLLAVASTALLRDGEAARSLAGSVGGEIQVQTALDRIAADLRLAGEWGEDRNRDGLLNPGEDLNGNGVLDAHWNLADGDTQDSISLNARVDDIVAGELKASGIYSGRITYRLESSRLVREWESVAGGSPRTMRAVLAHDIDDLRFSREGRLVSVSMGLRVPAQAYAPGRRTYAHLVWLRN